MVEQSKPSATLTQKRWGLICAALGWVEAAGDHSEFTETLSQWERAELWRAIENLSKQVLR